MESSLSFEAVMPISRIFVPSPAQTTAPVSLTLQALTIAQETRNGATVDVTLKNQVQIKLWPGDPQRAAMEARIASGELAVGTVVKLSGSPEPRQDVIAANPAKGFNEAKVVRYFLLHQPVVKTLDELAAARETKTEAAASK